VNGELIVATQVTLNSYLFKLLIYSLADPLSPQLVSNTTINYSFVSDLLVNSTGTAAFIPIFSLIQGFGGLIQDQTGSFLSLDLSNPSQPQLADVLFNDRGSPGGGDNPEHGGVLVNDNLAYVASTTSSGGDWSSGTGRLLIVNTSDPADLSEVGYLDIPGTVELTDVAISGNEALVVGNTGGYTGNIPNVSLSGNVTLTLLDISNPDDPQIVGSTIVTQETLGGTVVSLPNGEFLVSGTELNGQPVLLLVDPSDPTSLAVGATIVPSGVAGMTVSGNTLYATTNQGLSVYNVGPMAETPVTVSLEVPNNTGVSIVPNSFNVPPSQTIVGTDYDTLVWTETMAALDTNFTFTWQTTVSYLGSGETRAVTLGTFVTFTDQGTSGSLTLPATSVTGVPIIELIPTSQTTQPGGTATYDVRLTNPTNAQVTYYIYEQDDGNFFSVDLDQKNYDAADVTVGPEGTVDVPLAITTSSNAAPGDNSFTVTAESFDQPGALGTAQGDLTLAGTPVPQSDLNAYGWVATLTPSQATAGQGTSANYIVQLTNTGSTDERFSREVSGLPNGVYAYFPGNSQVDVPPGASNFVDQQLTLEVSPGTAPGSYPFTVTYTGYTDEDSPFTATAEGTLTVVANGVNVYLDPSSGNPGSTFDMLVYNTGTVQDTFDLSLGGPAALVSSLATDQVTLSPGSYQYVSITTSSVSFADPGTLELTATATSEGNPNVQDSARAELNIAPTQGMTAQFQPPVQVISVPGSTSFLLLVNNTGNTQDSYSATITGTTGPVTASLTGLDGNPTQSIPEFILPGLSTGAIMLQANLASSGLGTVTVQVQSLSNPSETVTAAAAVVGLSSSPTTPATPGAPTLLPADDSGIQGDDITDVTSPRLTGTAIPNALVELIDANNNILAWAATDASGNYTVQVPGPLSPGIYQYRVQAIDQSGGVSGPSNPLSLTIVAPPPIPAAPTLLPADDSGYQGDDVTDVASPHLTGTALADATVQLLDSNGNVLSTTTSDANGVYTVPVPGPLSVGTYQYRVQDIDQYGDVSSPSVPLSLTIVAAPPTPAAPTLLPADSNGSPGGETTTLTSPYLTGTGVGNAYIELLDAQNDLIAYEYLYVSGTYTIQVPGPLSVGSYSYRVREFDRYGDLSNPSPPQTITVVSAALTQPVIQLTASPGSTTTYGQSVSFTATVGPPASGDPTPTGSVQFQIDGSNFGSPVTLDDNGSATSAAISTLTAVGHTITALYSGDPIYAQGSQTLTQTVNPATPTVNVSAPNVTYDAAPYNALTSSVAGVNNANLGAASSFTYYAGMGTGGTDLGSTAPTAAGTYTVVGHYAGSADYAAADSVPTTFTIASLAITVTANPETKVYGTADAALTYQITSGSLAGTDTLTGSLTRAPGENVGSYAIGQGTLTAGLNYNLTFVVADLTITAATLVVTAGNLDINHGDSIPAPGYTVTGFVRGDTQAVLSGAPTFSTPPNANNAAGVYPITIGQGSLAATNYVFQFVAGRLTVHPKVTDVDIQWGKQTMSIMNLHRDLPFTDITAIDIVFSDDVTVTESDMALTSVTVPLYSFSGFRYNSAAHEATWTLPTALGIDQLMLALDGTSAKGVHTTTSNIPLLSNLGMGFSVLPGDVDGDGVVTVLDAVDVMNDMAANQPYSVWADVVGDGEVDMNDYLAVRIRKGTKLPGT
jgi:hypothetical protein